MTYTITSNCISCNRCLTQCPTQAVRQEGQHYWIEADLCNDCVGFYNVPQCAAFCPTNGGCIASEVSVNSSHSNTDYWESWFNTYNRIVKKLPTQKQAHYWERWFATYSQKLAQQIQAQTYQTASLEA